MRGRLREERSGRENKVRAVTRESGRRVKTE